MITIKNKKTGKAESIEQHEIRKEDWGICFFIDSEIEAYKAAYEYRNSKYGAEVKFAGGAKRWQVTVFNELGAKLKFNQSR